MKFAFMIMGNYDRKKDRVSFGDGSEMIGVSDIDMACEEAKELLASGVDCIEVCGAFGQNGAERLIEATGNKVAIGYVVHTESQNPLFEALFGKE